MTLSDRHLRGTVFSVWTSAVNFTLLLWQAVATETGDQEDSEPKGAYPAKVEKIESKNCCSLAELLRFPGTEGEMSDAQLLVDSERRVFLVLASQSDNKDLFTAMNIGLTYGKEQKFPTRMDNNQHTDSDVAIELLADDDVTCLATCTTLPYPSQYVYVSTISNAPYKSVFSCVAFNFGRNIHPYYIQPAV
ncbi:hypothetical protein K438DRAFT_1972377 [Mycena galopus ATCC 62051]|nr:hypothetical protein K438DRAFT_1972377 [Mycena galopus ATCC 62051]